MDVASTLFTWMGQLIKNTCQTIMSITLTDSFSWIQTAIVAIVGLMITYKGYQTLMGQSQQPIKELTWDISKKLFIMLFVLNTNGWLTQANELCNAFYDWAGGGKDMYSKLDGATNAYIASMRELLSAIKGIDGVIQFVILGVANTVALGFGIFAFAFTIFISQLTNSLLVFILPLALFCLMWQQTRRVFEQWLSLFISNLITLIIYTKVAGTFLDMFTAQMSVNKVGSRCIVDGLTILGEAFIMVVIVKMATSLAQGMAGASLEAAGAGIGVGMAGATGAGFGMVSKLALNTPTKALDLAFGSKNTTTGKREGGLVGGVKGTYNFGKQAVNFTKSMLSKNDK